MSDILRCPDPSYIARGKVLRSCAPRLRHVEDGDRDRDRIFAYPTHTWICQILPKWKKIWPWQSQRLLLSIPLKSNLEWPRKRRHEWIHKGRRIGYTHHHHIFLKKTLRVLVPCILSYLASRPSSSYNTLQCCILSRSEEVPQAVKIIVHKKC